MDPSLFLCTVRDSFRREEEVPPGALLSLQKFSLEKGTSLFPSLPDLFSLRTTYRNELPLYNFTEPQALLWADIDATFRLTDALPDVFWAFPTGEYPARQAFSVSYLTPRLIGNFNMGNWNCPGVEYFAYRRPAYFQYAYANSRETSNPEEFRTLLSFNEEEFLNSILNIQVDGLDLFISWQEAEKSLYLALKTLRRGGSFVQRVEEDPQVNLLSQAGRGFEEVYLFKPVLSDPLSRERFLVCLGRKENLALEDPFPLKEVKEYLEYSNQLLSLYQERAREGKLPYLPPTTCYIRWNLPQEIKKKVVCFKRNEDLLNLEEETGTEKEVLDSSQWNRRTSALAITEDRVFLAKPYYLGGWHFLGEYKKKELLDIELRVGGNCLAL